MRVLAIDPGYERMGVAVLERINGKKESVVLSECVITKRSHTHANRLHIIGNRIAEIIKETKPDALAIETLYFNSNQKTALLVAESRGVVLFESSRNNLRIFEFTPLQIKVATTGYGRADKAQMIAMVSKLLPIHKPIAHDDEYDALAVGITFFAHIPPSVDLSTLPSQ